MQSIRPEHLVELGGLLGRGRLSRAGAACRHDHTEGNPVYVRALLEGADGRGVRGPRARHCIARSAASLLGALPFLDYSPEIRRMIYSTNAIESLHARMRRAIRARGHFRNEQAALKCLYLAVRSLNPTGRGRRRWMNRWLPALNAFQITFEGRLLRAGE